MTNHTPPLWTSEEIAKATGGICTGLFDIHGISIDSRNINEGDLFIALRGPNFDGHDFAKQALEKGAGGVLLDRKLNDCDTNKQIITNDSFTALQKLGEAARARTKATIIAVTGSVGKTGCKEALRQVLGDQAKTYASIGSFNNHWGVPLSLARMARDCQFGVFEIGMNHMGELGPLSKTVRPHIALITAIAAVHIGNFKNLEEIATAKSEIFEGLEKDGHAVINADTDFLDLLVARAQTYGTAPIHSFGKKGVDAKLVDYQLHADTSTISATLMGQDIAYTIGVAGEHWVANSIGVLLTAKLAGANIDKAMQTLGKLQLAAGRGQPESILIKGGSFTLIDESYNASPVAVEMAINVLGRKTPATGGRRILVLGDMKELGPHAQSLHQNLAKPIIDAKIDTVFCCGETTQHLLTELPAHLQGGHAFTSALLAPLVASAIQPNDIVTVKGSHSMEMDKIVKALRGLCVSSSQSSSQSSSHPTSKTAHG